MLQERVLNQLITSLNRLNHHILLMHKVIDTYVDVLMDLNPNSLELVTDTYHKESLKYGELQKEIILYFTRPKSIILHTYNCLSMFLPIVRSPESYIFERSCNTTAVFRLSKEV